MTDIDSYLSFALKLFMVFGLTFEIPVITLLLILAGIVTIDSLEDKRRYILSWAALGWRRLPRRLMGYRC